MPYNLDWNVNWSLHLKEEALNGWWVLHVVSFFQFVEYTYKKRSPTVVGGQEGVICDVCIVDGEAINWIQMNFWKGISIDVMTWKHTDQYARCQAMLVRWEKQAVNLSLCRPASALCSGDLFASEHLLFSHIFVRQSNLKAHPFSACLVYCTCFKRCLSQWVPQLV